MGRRTTSRRTFLGEYREKRDFGRTSEPRGRRDRTKSAQPIFVIQKHGAKRLHYDLRLEVNGVLKSWAVPKGPSLNPREKRLAIATEDHPLEYSRFEGVIPPGEYGAGPILVWDRGTYRNIAGKHGGRTVSIDRSLKEGHVEVDLKGKKLKGKFALRLINRPNQWLLIKIRDERADNKRDPLKVQPNSVLSHKSIEDFQVRGPKGRRPRSR
jgi:DNA ligase D-like protein (predicted 3'-phosphoesterase)